MTRDCPAVCLLVRVKTTSKIKLVQTENIFEILIANENRVNGEYIVVMVRWTGTVAVNMVCSDGKIQNEAWKCLGSSRSALGDNSNERESRIVRRVYCECVDTTKKNIRDCPRSRPINIPVLEYMHSIHVYK